MEIETTTLKFNKDTILKSKKYIKDRDLLFNILKDNIEYSEKEIKKIIEKYNLGVID